MTATALDPTIDTTEFADLANYQAPFAWTYNRAQPGRVFLTLNADGACDFYTIGAVHCSPTARVRFGEGVHSWEFPSAVHGDVLHSMLTDPETLELLQQMHDGDDADDADVQLERLLASIDDRDCVTVWDAAEYLENSVIPQVWTPDQTLAQAVEAIATKADKDRDYVDKDDLAEVLLEKLRIEMVGEDFQPSALQLAALEADLIAA